MREKRNGNEKSNKIFPCPDWIIALLKDIDNRLQIAYWNKNQEEMLSPFGNTGNSYKGSNFEVQAYNWNEETEQPYNFKYKDIEISWYKYLGRGTTINGQYPPDKIIEMYNDIISEFREEK